MVHRNRLINTMSIPTNCREVEAITELFDSNRVSGLSPLLDLRYVGPYLSERAATLPAGLLALNDAMGHAPHSIKTVNDLILKASQARTRVNVDRLLEHCSYNKRRNTCVVQGATKPKYHVPDVNVCGYNSLLAVLRYAHTHKGTHDFPPQYTLSAAVKLLPRRRGDAAGSRYCSCIETVDGCQAHGGDCRWNTTQSVCHSRAQGTQPGFKGARAPNTARQLGQRIKHAHNTTRSGLDYKGEWRQPVAPEPPGAAANAPAAPPAPPPQPPAAPAAPAPLRRSTRTKTQPRRFQGGGNVPVYWSSSELQWLDRHLHSLESLSGGQKASGARRFRNFVHLTNIPSS